MPHGGMFWGDGEWPRKKVPVTGRPKRDRKKMKRRRSGR